MKTTIDIPEETLSELLRQTGARTKREAVLKAVEAFNRQHAVDSLVATFGTWKVDSNDEIEAADMREAERSR